MRSITALTLAVSLALVGCTTDDGNDDINDNNDTNDVQDQMDETIIGVAEDNGSFTTLLAAVDAAGLTETLQSDGPFTVLAPTDDAFAKLPEGTVEALLEDTETLTDILLYHVVDGSVTSDVVVQQSLVTTLNGVDFKVTVDGDVYINDAMVTITDIEASNGVIHVIDTVLLPPPSITEIAAADANFETLVTAVVAADLADTLAGPGPFTVFAPTDDAFAKLPEGTIEALLDDTETLTDILLFHVADEKLPASEVVSSSMVETLNGEAMVNVDGSTVTIDGAAIIVTDIPANNGIIHVIDAVMLPE